MKGKRRSLVTVVLLINTLFLCSFVYPVLGTDRPNNIEHQQPSRPASARKTEPARPKLVVLIVLDQVRQEYLERFKPLFGEGGFRRLLAGGASFSNCRYVHFPTFTAPGHGTVLTGTTPSNNGIIGNWWFDRLSGEFVTSVSDKSRKLLGVPTGPAASPHRLIGTTLGDELRMSSNNRSKVIGVAFKDRSAILPAGKDANLAVWFDAASGLFVTSDYYADRLPDWVEKINATKPADKFFGARWERILPEKAYETVAVADDQPGEDLSPGGTRTFPHIITGGLDKPGPRFYNALEDSPFASEMLLDLAKAAIDNEKLGVDDEPDILSIGFSANDEAGHLYGPHSQEVADLTLRTDRLLASLLGFLDSRIGRQNYLVVVTADHGVAPTPEYATDHKLNGQRISPDTVRQAIEHQLSARFGEGKWIEEQAARLVADLSVYLNRSTITGKGLDPAVVERAAGDAALSIPGVYRAYTRTEMLSGRFPKDLIGTLVANGFHPERSPDVILIPEPMSIVWANKGGTTHGSPYSYDTHVPLIFYGSRVKPGVYSTVCSPCDIAPTLAVLFGVGLPTVSTGQVLQQVWNGL
jgi:predicted AlkP superfamily pyrophosphatase or phosphodiesterase